MHPPERPGSDFHPAPQHPGSAIRTFHPRRAPLGVHRADALERLWPTFGISVHDPELGLPPLTDNGHLDTLALFGRHAPVVVEIGSGMGDATAAMAAADPDRDYLAVEVHQPGIAHLLTLIEDRALTNLRLAHGDALDLLRVIAPDSVDAVHVFFPDPWPKARHHKRRIIAPDHVALIASRLRPGGALHCATDWEPYAEQMVEVIDAEPLLRNPHAGYAPRMAARPVTRFEQRGVDAGRVIRDVVGVRV
ncbi:tRNA (guanosine(46)-N7)-methyltransferase TrmB [Cellulomonas sp. NPDC089187]|uniref:tRNA (guanosine(46)-N7)-methyltransferase TrmB n=1 Tax=Cellulomonas sp. NPDC089187 TaxID=3154970 RepID=UPI0034313FAC